MRACARCVLYALFAIALVAITGCHHQTASLATPPATPPPLPQTAEVPPPLAKQQSAPIAPRLSTAIADTPADLEFVQTHAPIYTEEGLASWYGPPYHNRRGANGKIYDQNALTAAHRTLPLNSLIQVTNVATGRSAIMRVTDRGPFVPGRKLDLSLASAKAIGVWRAGVAPVRIDVYATPSPIDQGGRWCVQIGAFRSSQDAIRLRDHLARKYETARVIEFAGPTGYWVRIRPQNDEKSRAVEIAGALKPSDGEAYLVRLD